MCGIAGIVRREGEASSALIEKMAQLLRHRGPDDQGFFVKGAAALGFCRLSIIDLEGGHQPLSNEDDRYWIVFNGEIYNFQELRRELEATGRHRFKTNHSDTEVILHLYEEYGEDCLSRLRGMFAFAIWDAKRETLFAARDRFGKKPFVYFQAPDGTLVFASELKSLAAHPQCPKTIDVESINLYLSLQYIPAPKTIYGGVSKLPASHALRWSKAKGVQTWNYWDLKYEPKVTVPYDEAKRRLREAVMEAVRMRMVADVPLGAYLSGGVDSSIIVAAMAQQSNRPIKTFSIGFDEADYTELPYARAVAKKYATDHHEFVVRPELIDVVPKLAWFYSEPFADSSALPSYYLARETRKHVTVTLTGDGGDEMFAGYLRYRAIWGLQWWNYIPAAARRMIAAAADSLPSKGAPVSPLWRVQRLLRVGSMPYLEQYGRSLEYFHKEELAELWSPEYADVLGQAGASSNARFEETLKAYCPSEILDRLMYLDLHHYLPDCLMVKTDIATMANSLEARAPFLDHLVAEQVARFPAGWKFRPLNQSKRILKDAFRNDLPDEILRRGKQGFGVPISHWFRGALKDYLRETLLSDRARARGYFNMKVVERYVDDHQAGRRDRSYGLWALLMLEQWFRTFVDGESH